MKKIILLGITLFLFSCSTNLYIPIEATTTATLSELKTGREIYVKKCSSCHHLHLPHQYNSKVWIKNLDEMQVRAKITNADKELIYQYIVNAPSKK